MKMRRTLVLLVLTAGVCVAQQSSAQALERQLQEQLLQKNLDLQVASLEAQLAKLRKQYTEAYPAIRELRARLERLREQVPAGVAFTPLQNEKMQEVVQRFRLKLIDLNAALEKEEIILEPLVAAEKLDEARIVAQIDRVAQARAELEKLRGRMLLEMRKLMDAEQWRKLNESGQNPMRQEKR